MLVGVLLSPAVFGRLAPPGWHDALFGGGAIERQLSDAEQQFRQSLREELDTLEARHEDAMQRLGGSDVSPAATQEQQRQYQQARRTIQRWLEAEGPIERLLADYEREFFRQLEPGATKQAIEQARQRYQRRRAQLRAVQTEVRDTRAARLLVAVLIAVGVVMVLEPLVGPRPAPRQSRAAVSPRLGRLKSVRYALLAIALALLLARPGIMTDGVLSFALVLAGVALILGLVPLSRKKADNHPAA